MLGDRLEVTVPAAVARIPAGIVVHRRTTFTALDVETRHAIPVTTPLCTLIDLATCLDRRQLELAIIEADKRDLISPEELRCAIDDLRRPGAHVLRETLDRTTFTLTDSELERHFLPISRKAGLSTPLTGQTVKGWKTDFSWPDIGLVVETDGLRYHRTPQQQAKDRRRDQAYTAAGLTPLRFHAGAGQIRAGSRRGDVGKRSRVACAREGGT